MSTMAAETPINPFWVVVGGVALLTLIVRMIQRGNRRQRPILWGAFVVIVIMTLFPPWLGERDAWVDLAEEPGSHDPHYVCSPVSMGYAFILLPPRRTAENTTKPMAIHWSRLFVQVGLVGLIAAGPVVAFRTKRIRRKPAEEADAGGEPDRQAREPRERSD